MEIKEEKTRPRVGVGVVVVKDGKVLLGKRKGSHGAGCWSLAGGHLEFGEKLEECARRELLEETGLKAISCKIGPWSNDVMEDNKHYITLFALVDDFEGDPQLLEPNKCEGWQWFDWHSLPAPLFYPVRSLIDKISLDRLKSASSANFPSYADENPFNALLLELFEFYKERDWEKFHSPKNLAMNLATEVGELIEPFRWLTEQDSFSLDEKTLREVSKEIGDVFNTLVYLAYKLGIDPLQAAHDKIEDMGKKYPAEQCRGKALKYTAYERKKDL